MSEVITYHRWLVGVAAGLATAVLTLPPIAYDELRARWLILLAVAALSLSAYCGIAATKLYVAAQLSPDDVPDADPDVVVARKGLARSRGQTWALSQSALFAVGALLAGISLGINLILA